MLGSMLDSESLIQQAVRCQLAAMPNKFFLIRLIHSVERKPAPARRLWTAEELTRDRVVHSLRADNRLGFNVYLWPYAERRNAGYIFLDLDHARPHVLEDMRIHGHQPCVVLETSPDSGTIGNGNNCWAIPATLSLAIAAAQQGDVVAPTEKNFKSCAKSLPFFRSI